MRKLQRIKEGSVFLGVCTGLSDYFSIDVSIFRLVFMLLFFLWGLGALLYLALAMLMPVDKFSGEEIRENIAKFFGHGKKSREHMNAIGLIISILGLFFLLYAVGVISFTNIVFIPLCIIAIGIVVMTKKQIDINTIIILLIILLLLSIITSSDIFHLL